MLPLLFFVAIGFNSYAQDKNEEGEAEHWEVVDVQPDYPGGMTAFYKYVRKNLAYPKEAKKEKVKGKVFVEFVIDSTGSVRDETVRVLKGIGHGCDEEAVRLVKESPDWIPGRISKRNENAPVRMVLPIHFNK